jgi:hypothetical protein
MRNVWSAVRRAISHVRVAAQGGAAALAVAVAGGAAIAALMPAPAMAQEPNFGRAIALAATELFVGQPVNWYGPGVVYTYRLDARELGRSRRC